MARVLTKIRIDEVSLVERGAGEGVKVVLMKRAEPRVEEASRRGAYEKFLKIFTSKADAADDGADDAGDRSAENTSLADHPIVQLAQLLVASGGKPDLASAVHYLLNTSSGAGLLHRVRTHKGVDPMQDTFLSIMKSAGIAVTCAQIVAKGSTSLSEEEIVLAVSKIAAERFPDMSPAQAFSKIYTASTDEARVLQKSIEIAKLSPFDIKPLMVGSPAAMHEAVSDTEQSEAYRQLEAMAEKLRAAHPELSAASAFANVFTDPKNASVSAKAHRRPSATTSFAFPR